MLLKTFFLLVWFLCPTYFLNATTLTVIPTDNLQQVIDNAQKDDTISIQPGLYKQPNIFVNKRLTIIGVGYPVFDGELKHTVFTVTANGTTIKGLQVQNTGKSSMEDMAGIKLKSVRDVTVRGCKILNTTYAVYLENSRNCIVIDNIIEAHAENEQQSGNGVHAWKCDSLFIDNNFIKGHRDGIYFEFVTHSMVSHNTSIGNIRYGLHFMFSHNDVYNYNLFSSNGAGVAVMFTKHVTMYGNTFYHNWGAASYGILLKEISDSKIECNVFEKNTMGIFMEGGSRIYVADNEFSYNGWAMRIQASSADNVFKRNNFIGNSFDVATNGTMMLNTFNGNYWDKYDGYDLGRDGIGDVPYYPVSVYAIIVERVPTAMILYRSFLTNIMDQVEKVMPTIIPDQLKDDAPCIKKLKL